MDSGRAIFLIVGVALLVVVREAIRAVATVTIDEEMALKRQRRRAIAEQVASGDK